MISFFAGLIAGIAIGWSTMALLIVWRETREDTPADYDLSDLMHDIEPEETPLLLSIIEQHRQKHLAAKKGK